MTAVAEMWRVSRRIPLTRCGLTIAEDIFIDIEHKLTRSRSALPNAARQEDRNRTSKSYRRTQEGRVFQSAARTHQISRNDGFAVSRR